MSELLDERVVEMRFDNADFEHNVDQSIKTINRLKESLDFEEAGESFDNISKAAASCDLSPMENSIEEISVKFNMLDLVAANVMSNIANKVADAGIKLAKSLTLDQISAGWNKYEQKTQAVQTIMAATGQSIDVVNSQLEKLIWFADETSYSFTDMVNNIGKFTSAGVDLNTAVKSMMGISDWAALSGAGVQQASRVMYNLSQSIGMGYVAIQDWKSVELANMATLDFKEAVIETALAMGKIVQVGDKFKAVGGKVEFTAETMRNSLKERWFDSDVLNAALEEYSSFADQVREYQEEHNIATAKSAIKLMEQEGYDLSTRAAQAFIKAQEAITFSQVIESVQDAVSSQLMRSFELIFGNYEQAKRLWSDLADDLWDIFASPGERFNEMLGEVLNSNYQKLAEELPDKLEFNNALYKKLYDITKANAGEDYADALFSQYQNIEDLLKNSNIFGSTLQTAFGSITKDYDKEYERLVQASKNFENKIISLKQVAIRLSGGMYGHDEETIEKNLEKIGLKYEEVADYAEIWYQMGDQYNWDAAQKDFEKGLQDRIKMVKDFRGQLREYLNMDDIFDSLTELGGRDKLIGGFENIMSFVKNFYIMVSEIVDGLAHMLGRESFLSFMIDGFYNLTDIFGIAGAAFDAFTEPIYDFFHGGIQDKFNKFIHGYDEWVADSITLDSGMTVGSFEHIPGLIERLTDFYKVHIQSIPIEVQNALSQINSNVSAFFSGAKQKIEDFKERFIGTQETIFKKGNDGKYHLTKVFQVGEAFDEWKEKINSFANGLIPKALNGISGFLEKISGFLFGYKTDTEEFQGAISWVYDKVKAFIDLLKTIGKSAKDIFDSVLSDIKTFFVGGKYSFSDSTIWALPARLKKHFEDLKKTPAFQEVKSFIFGDESTQTPNILGKISKVIKDLVTSTAFNDVKEFFFGKDVNTTTFGQAGHIPGLFEKIGTTIKNLVESVPFKEIKTFILGDFETGEPSIFGRISKAISGITENQTYKDIKAFLFGKNVNQASFGQAQHLPGVFDRIKTFVTNIGNYIETIKNKFHEFRQWLGLDFYQYFSWNPETKEFESHWQRIHGAIDIAKDKVTEFGQKISTTFGSIWDSSIVQSVIKFISGDYFEGGPVTWKTALFGNKETEELSFLQYQLERIKGTDWFSNIKDFLFGVKNTNLDVNGSALNSFIRFFHTAEEYKQANIFGKIKLAFEDLKVYLFGWKENADGTGASIEGVFDKVKKKIDEIRNSKAFNDILDFILGKKKVIGTDIDAQGRLVPIFERTGGLINNTKDGIIKLWNIIKNTFTNVKEWFNNIVTDAGYTSIHDFIFGNDKIGLDNVLVRTKNSLHDFFLGNEAKGIDNFLVRTKNTIHDFFLGNEAKGIDNLFIQMKNGFTEIIHNAGYTSIRDFFLGNSKIGLDNIFIRTFDALKAKFDEIKSLHPWIQNIADFISEQFQKIQKKIDEIFPGLKEAYKSLKEFFFGYNIGGKSSGLDTGTKHIDGLIDRIENFVQRFKKIDIFKNNKNKKSLFERIADGLIGAGNFISKISYVTGTVRKLLPAIALIGVLLMGVSTEFFGFKIQSPLDNLVDTLQDFVKSVAIIAGLLIGIPFLIRILDINAGELVAAGIIIAGIMGTIVGLSFLINGKNGNAGVVESFKDAASMYFFINFIKTLTALVTALGILAVVLSVTAKIIGVWNVLGAAAAISAMIIAIGVAVLLMNVAFEKSKDATGKIKTHAGELFGIAAIIFSIGILISKIVNAFAIIYFLTKNKSFIDDLAVPLAILLGVINVVGIFVAGIVAATVLLSKTKPIPKTVLFALVSMEAFILALMGMAFMLSIGVNKNDWQTLAAAFGGIAVVVLAMVGCLAILSHIKNLPVKNIIALIGVFSALALIVGVFSLFKKITGFTIKPLDIFKLLISIGEIVIALFPLAKAIKILGSINLSGKDYLNTVKVLAAVAVLAVAVWRLSEIANKANIHTYDAILPMLAAIGEVAAAMVVVSGLLLASSFIGSITKNFLKGAIVAIVGFGVLAGAVAGLAAIANGMNIHTYDAVLPMLVAIGEVAAAMVVVSVALVAASALGTVITGLLLGAVTAIVGFGVLAGAVAGLAAIANGMNIHTYDAVLPMLVAIGEVAAAMAITSGLLVVASALGMVLLSLLPGLVAAIVGFGILAVAVWGLTKLSDKMDPGSLELISNFVVSLGETFGKMIGAFIGGIGEGLTSSLPQIGENISGFMIALQPFLDAVKLIDDSHVTGATNFMKIMGTIVADEALGWLATLFDNFTGDKVQTATNLGDFIAALEPFLSRVSTLTETDVNGAKFFTAIMTTLVPDEALAWLTTLFDKFTDDKVKAATNLGDFVTALEPFLSGVATLKESDKEGAALLTEIMKEVVKTEALTALDNVIKYFCGTTNYSLFTYNLKTIAQGIVDLNSKLNENGITKDIVDTDIGIIRSVLDLVTDNKYKSGGLAGMFDSILNGKTNFKELFDKLNTDVAEGFAQFAGKVKGIEVSDAAKAADVLPSILNLLSGNGYRIGGIKGWFTNLFEGENNYDAMFKALIGEEGKKGIIDYMSELSTKIKGLDNLNEGDLTILSTAADAIKSIFSMMAFNTSDLINDDSFEIFGKQLTSSSFDKLIESIEVMINGSEKHPGGIPGVLSEMEEKLKSVDVNVIQNTIGVFLDLIKTMGSVNSGNINLDTQGISEIGKFVVEGLAISLESEESTSRIKTAAINLGKAIIEGLQIGTEEQSPSKAAMVVGQFVAQGLTNGLLAGEPLTWAMARQFGEGTIKALKDGAERYAQYGLAEHAINMVTEDLLDENIFNMPDFSFINHLGMEDIDFEKMRSFLQEKFGEVFDPTIIDGFVNSYKHTWEQLPKEIKDADYAKLMVDIAKEEYGAGQDAIIDTLTKELGSVTAAQQAWEDYNDVLEGNIKINKDLLKQRKQDPPMTYEDYIAMIEHEQEGIDLLNKGFFHDLAGKNGTTVEEEMANWGFNPKTTQQAIDAMYMSSEEFYKHYEDYINKRADEAEQDRLLREREKEYEKLADNVENTKEQTDALTDSTNHFAADIKDIHGKEVVLIDDTGSRKTIDEVNQLSKDIIDTVIENYQNGAKTTREQINELLLSKVADGADPNQTVMPRLKKAGIEITDFMDYLNQYASNKQKQMFNSIKSSISGTVEELTEEISTTTEKAASSVDKVEKIFGEDAESLIKSGMMTQKGIDYIRTADGKALNELINNIQDGATDLKEADRELLKEFREAYNTHGAFGILNSKSEKENNFTAFGLSQDNYKFIWDYLSLGDEYIDKLIEVQKASQKLETQEKKTGQAVKLSQESWYSGLSGTGKDIVDTVVTSINESFEKGSDKIEINWGEIAEKAGSSLEELRKDLGDKADKVLGKDGIINYDLTKLLNAPDSSTAKKFIETNGIAPLINGIFSAGGFDLDVTQTGAIDQIVTAFKEDLPGALVSIANGFYKVKKDGIAGFIPLLGKLYDMIDAKEELEKPLDFQTDNKALSESQAYIDSLYTKYKLLESEEDIATKAYQNLTSGGVISKQQKDILEKMFNGVTIGAYGDVTAFHNYLEGIGVDWETFLTYHAKGLDTFTSSAQEYASEVKKMEKYTSKDLMHDIEHGKWGEGLDRKNAFEAADIDYEKAMKLYAKWRKKGDKLFEDENIGDDYAFITEEEKKLAEQQKRTEAVLNHTPEGAFNAIGGFLEGVSKVLEGNTADDFVQLMTTITDSIKGMEITNASEFDKVANFLNQIRSATKESSALSDDFNKLMTTITTSLNGIKITSQTEIAVITNFFDTISKFASGAEGTSYGQIAAESIQKVVDELNSIQVDASKTDPVTSFLNELISAYNTILEMDGGGVKTFVDNLYGSLKDNKSEAASAAEEIVQLMIQTFNMHESDFWNVGWTFIKWVTDGMSAASTIAVDAANQVSTAIIAAFSQNAVSTGIKDAGKEFSTGLVSGMVEGIASEDTQAMIDGALRGMFGLGEATTEGMMGAANGMMLGAQGGMLGATGSIGQQIGSQFSQDFVTGFSTALTANGTTGGVFTTLQSTFSSLLGIGGEEGAYASSGFGESMANSFKGIADGLKNAMDGEAGSSIQDTAKQIGDMISGAIPDGTSLGENFVAGFLQGLINGLEMYGDQIREVAAKIGELANISTGSAIQVASPSKTAMRMGTYFVEGFAIGLGKDHSNIYDTGYAIGKAVEEGTRDSLGIHSPSAMARYLASNYTGTFLEFLKSDINELREAGYNLGDDVYKSTYEALTQITNATGTIYTKAGEGIKTYGAITADEAAKILKIWTDCMNGAYGVMDEFGTRNALLASKTGYTWEELYALSDGRGHLDVNKLMNGDYSSAIEKLGDDWDIRKLIDIIDHDASLVGKAREDFVLQAGLDPKDVQNIINERKWLGSQFSWDNYDPNTGKRLEESDKSINDVENTVKRFGNVILATEKEIEVLRKNILNGPVSRFGIAAQVKKDVTSISNSITGLTNLSDLSPVKGESKGKSFFEGIKNGFDKMKEKIKQKAAEVAGKANEGVEKKEDMHSPSKVFMQYGAYMIEGLALGIQQSTHLAEASTENMSDTISSLFSNSVSNISDVVEDNINTEPVIRPVIDMSDVEKSASSIDAMLSTNKAVSISASEQALRKSFDEEGIPAGGTVMNFTQNNYSPKALSRLDIYRQTRNQFAQLKEARRFAQ